MPAALRKTCTSLVGQRRQGKTGRCAKRLALHCRGRAFVHHQKAIRWKHRLSDGRKWCCCSAQDTYIPARGKAVVKTGLSIAIPAETYARVAPRSGLAVKHFIDTGAGVVDEDYRGEVGVVLFNHSNVDFQGELPVTTLI